MQNNSEKDPVLWEIAQKRVSFKWNLASYIVVNLFLWGVWYFTAGDDGSNYRGIPWPIWPTMGWGVGIVFHYLGAYSLSKQNSVEEEYQKLMRSKQNKND